MYFACIFTCHLRDAIYPRAWPPFGVKLCSHLAGMKISIFSCAIWRGAPTRSSSWNVAWLWCVGYLWQNSFLQPILGSAVRGLGHRPFLAWFGPSMTNVAEDWEKQAEMRRRGFQFQLVIWQHMAYFKWWTGKPIWNPKMYYPIRWVLFFCGWYQSSGQHWWKTWD